MYAVFVYRSLHGCKTSPPGLISLLLWLDVVKAVRMFVCTMHHDIMKTNYRKYILAACCAAREKICSMSCLQSGFGE